MSRRTLSMAHLGTSVSNISKYTVSFIYSASKLIKNVHIYKVHFSYSIDLPPLCIILIFARPNFDGFFCMSKHIWCYLVTHYLPNIKLSNLDNLDNFIFRENYIFMLYTVKLIVGLWDV